jgi:hypothetical protein
MEVKRFLDLHIIIEGPCPFIPVHEVLDVLVNHPHLTPQFIEGLMRVLEKAKTLTDAKNN